MSQEIQYLSNIITVKYRISKIPFLNTLFGEVVFKIWKQHQLKIVIFEKSKLEMLIYHFYNLFIIL